MVRKLLLGLFASLALTACFQQENAGPGSPGEGAERPRVQDLYLLPHGEIEGRPHYLPVEFIDDMAVVEGDIVIAQGEEEVRRVRERVVDPSRPLPLAKGTGFVKSDAIFARPMAWPDGRIPYEFDANFPAGKQTTILQAVYEWNKNAAIRYVPYKGQGGARVKFKSIAGSSSNSAVGKQASQPQAINIGDAGVGTVMHEMGHAAGFYHEHSRTDRGSYVKIVTAGTDKGGAMARNYNIPTDGAELTPYDYLSIMHYSSSTVTYRNPDGTFFFVQVKPLNGQTVNNDKLSTWDNYALWLFQYINSAAVFTAVAADANLFKHKLYEIRENNRSRWFLARFSPAGENLIIHEAAENDDAIGPEIQHTSIGPGFGSFSTYFTNSKDFMIFYSPLNGRFLVFALGKDGRLGAKVQDGSLPTGFTHVEPYWNFTKYFVMFRNAGTGDMSIRSVNADGTVGAETFAGNADWQSAKVYYIEKSQFILTPHILLRRNSDGLCRLQELDQAGGLGAVVQEKALDPGVSSIAVYQGGASAFLLLSHSGSAWTYEITRTGFRDDARRQRILNFGKDFVNMDAANTLFRPAPTGNRTGTSFDMGHRLILTWPDLPQFLFLGKGFPFL